MCYFCTRAENEMEGLLLDRRIRLWELVCQQYTLPKSITGKLDKLIRAGEEIPPPKRSAIKKP